MNRKEIGEYLYRYYRKRTSSFLVNIYKASVTGDSRDIHRARLDVKNIYSLLGLFELIDPVEFNSHKGYKIFKPVFQSAGKAREFQVNNLLLNAPEYQEMKIGKFFLWLKEEEKSEIRKLLKSVKKFKEKDLEEVDKRIQQISATSSMYKLRSKTNSYLLQKATMINQLLDTSYGEEEIHEIRQHLKSMAAIATLVYTVKPEKELDGVITAINKTDTMIGDWHDRVVLRSAIGRFLEESKTELAKEEKQDLKKIKAGLQAQSENLVQHFMPEVKGIGEMIVSSI